MDATEYFLKQGYTCSESIIKYAIDKGYIEENLLAVATSFSGGMGSGCLCGAIAGSQMILGYLYGKGNKFNNEVIAKQKAKQFIEEFKKSHKATCCRVLTSGFDMSSQERKLHCANMVECCSKILDSLVEVKV